MKILLLCEPRSGGTNFANWFYHKKNYTVFFNPDIEPEYRNQKGLRWYQNGKEPEDYKYETEHLVIKEDYYHYKNYDKFINWADKIICLYRINEKEQIESWINARKTDNWDGQWIYNTKNSSIEEEVFFKNLKEDFKMKYINNNNFFSISYEELYKENGIEQVIKYIGTKDLEISDWPVGVKYRLENQKFKNII